MRQVRVSTDKLQELAASRHVRGVPIGTLTLTYAPAWEELQLLSTLEGLQ